ncbi:hypothetical protein BCON_0061g00240 [Botryotinia convoluta]|uniref:Uncharacterized protein n=1 Tax=Botryotinia convoluta TaxID=54673 RepID=A0A4Z1I8E1_9HELO|nr:hypothetical protein BCON_0061g00240 [Botryotinia convoluta]
MYPPARKERAPSTLGNLGKEKDERTRRFGISSIGKEFRSMAVILLRAGPGPPAQHKYILGCDETSRFD